jgi:hypothetical protein
MARAYRTFTLTVSSALLCIFRPYPEVDRVARQGTVGNPRTHRTRCRSPAGSVLHRPHLIINHTRLQIPERVIPQRRTLLHPNPIRDRLHITTRPLRHHHPTRQQNRTLQRSRGQGRLRKQKRVVPYSSDSCNMGTCPVAARLPALNSRALQDCAAKVDTALREHLLLPSDRAHRHRCSGSSASSKSPTRWLGSATNLALHHLGTTQRTDFEEEAGKVLLCIVY